MTQNDRIFAFVWALKNRQIGGVFAFFDTLGAKNTVNTNVLGTWEAQNHDIYSVFFASGSKNHGICNVFWPGPSKNTGIYVVFSMLQEDVFSCQKQKNIVNYTIFALGKQPKNCKKSPKKCPKWTSETHLGILASFFPIQNGPKSPKIPFLDVLKFRHPKIVQKLRKHHQYLDSVRNLERAPPS